MSTHDAIVIGGGPAGSSTALALARRGWRVAIVEKNAFPRRKVCGEFMSGTNSAILDRLGVGDAWRTTAGPEVRRVGLFCGETVAAAPMPAGRAFGRALGRDVLDEMLLDRARDAGAEVLQPWRAVAIERQGAGSAVQLESRANGDVATQVITAPVIVAAHGSWEPGHLPSQLDKVNRPSDLLGFKAHFRGATLPSDLMPLIAFPGGYGGMVWSDRGRLSASFCIRRDALAAARDVYGAPAAEALQRHLLISCRGMRDAIGRAALDGPWLAAGPIRPGLRPRFKADIFRVGNIAGESHPVIAEGISMAIQSGWLLAGELDLETAADPAARAAAGARYAQAWRRLFALRIYSAAAFAHLAIRPLTRAGMRIFVSRLPRLLTLGATLSGKARTVPGLR